MCIIQSSPEKQKQYIFIYTERENMRFIIGISLHNYEGREAPRFDV